MPSSHIISSFLFVFQVVELVPESQAYMDLLAFENKLDSTIMRKRLDIQEALKRPIKVSYPSSFSNIFFTRVLPFAKYF